MEDSFENTLFAREFAKDLNNSPDDVKSNWWEFFSNYRLKKWKRELKKLSKDTGVAFEDVCRYIGAQASSYPGFFKKLPRNRETYIGIGMAYGLSLDEINRWITEYGMKRKLYVKDIFNDLTWIYLINQNQKRNDADINCYRMYDSCREEIESLYGEVWSSENTESVDTTVLQSGFNDISYDDYHTQLKMYVRDNINSFRTAYVKPRKYLNSYVVEILRVKNAAMAEGHRWTLNSLRGWLDDSMINYLSGSYEHINALDKEKKAAKGFKHVPKNKKAHISLCLALGMSLDAIDEYLEMMGYSPLDAVNAEEGQLINLLRKWDEEHPVQKAFKDRYFRNIKETELTQKQELQAVEEMLFLREDMKQQYEELNQGSRFPYM